MIKRKKKKKEQIESRLIKNTQWKRCGTYINAFRSFLTHVDHQTVYNENDYYLINYLYRARVHNTKNTIIRYQL